MPKRHFARWQPRRTTHSPGFLDWGCLRFANRLAEDLAVPLKLRTLPYRGMCPVEITAHRKARDFQGDTRTRLAQNTAPGRVYHQARIPQRTRLKWDNLAEPDRQ